MNCKSNSILSQYAEYSDTELVTIKGLLTGELESFDTRIVVLDDDPTGIQTVHNVNVYTSWDKPTITQAFLSGEKIFYILTNSRSLSAADTESLHRTIAQTLCEISRESDMEFLLLSRSDSTLRGHYPLETETLRSEIECLLPYRLNGEIFCPFFPEGGRLTIDNIHYVEEGGNLIPAAETEFSHDKTFPFHFSDLTKYIEEKSNGQFTEGNCVSITLDELRRIDLQHIYEKLTNTENFRKIIVNAITYTDLTVFAIAWVRAMKSGHHYLARCAAALPKVIGGIPDKPLLTGAEICAKSGQNGGLVIVGSHVQKSSRQLRILMDSGIAHTALEFDVNSYFEPDGIQREAERILKETEASLLQGRLTIIYTSRQLLAPNDLTGEQLLGLSVQISAGLTDIVQKLSVRPRFLIAKGGITSSDIGTKGLSVKKAYVLGQISPGIPVWRTGCESRFPGLSYIIFPGNVGAPETLLEIVRKLESDTSTESDKEVHYETT